MSLIPPELADWVRLFVGATLEITRLSGGSNNGLFRCSGPKKNIVLKTYRSDALSVEPSRMNSEVEFLRYAAEQTPGLVPSLIDTNDELGAIAMSEVQGQLFTANSQITASEVVQLVKFYKS